MMMSGFGWAALALLFGYLALFFWGSAVAARAAGRPVWLFARARSRGATSIRRAGLWFAPSDEGESRAKLGWFRLRLVDWWGLFLLDLSERLGIAGDSQVFRGPSASPSPSSPFLVLVVHSVAPA